MDWGLLAGGVSKGLEDALAGANQGLLQGEAIRHQRAQEGMQQQHFGLQQQQLQRLMAQQDFQNRIAQQQFGLHRDQLAQQRDYQRGLLGFHAGQLEETARGHDITQRHYEQMAPWYQNRANYYANPAVRQTGMMKDLDGFSQARFGKSFLELEPGSPEQRAVEEEYHRTKNPLLPQRQRRYEDLHQHTQLMDQHLRNLIANPALSGAERATLALAQTKIRQYEAALFRVQRAHDMQTPPNPQDLALLEGTSLDALNQDIVNLKNVVATRGYGQANPGRPLPQSVGPSLDVRSLRSKHGY